MSEMLSAGYHGTSLTLARRILDEGFCIGRGSICFATDVSAAQHWGLARATECDEAQIGVLVATFPARPIKEGLLGPQVEVPARNIGDIVVSGLLVFDAQPSGLAVPISHFRLA
jgi:hypothetical protein